MPIPRGWPHRGIDFKFDFFSEFEFIFETALGYGSGDWGTCFDEKNQRQNFSCQCPFTVSFRNTMAFSASWTALVFQERALLAVEMLLSTACASGPDIFLVRSSKIYCCCNLVRCCIFEAESRLEPYKLDTQLLLLKKCGSAHHVKFSDYSLN